MAEEKAGRLLDMTVGNPFRLLMRFSMPLFLGNLLQQIYNIADTAIALPFKGFIFSVSSRSFYL